MNTNKVLANLKTGMLYLAVPLMMVACNNRDKGDVDAKLADVDAKIARIDAQLDSMQNQTDVLLTDSMSRDAVAADLSKKIKEYSKPLGKLTAPKDSTMRKRYMRKISSLRMDSMMRTHKVKGAIINQRMNEFQPIYAERDALIAMRDSLMKIKTR